MENIDQNLSTDNKGIIYAGFWVRVLGAVIDAFILGLMASTLERMVDKYSTVFPFFMLAIFAAYEIYFNAHFRGTPGKRILSLELLGLDLEPISYGRAALRFVLKFFLWFFLTSPIYLVALFSHVSEFVGLLGIILPAAAILMMLFNKHRQVLYDYLAKTIVVDRAESDAASASKIHGDENKFQAAPRRWTPLRVFRTLGIFAVVVVGAFSLYYFGMYLFVFGTLALHKQRAYDNSFHVHYTTRDYNDTRIQFYRKELDHYSREFIEADGMYDIFAADTKRDLALNCIEAGLKDHNVSDWINMGSNFRKNARNKYADTEMRIKKAKANEDWMGHHFYEYDTNDVNHIERKIANIWELKKNAKTCDALMPIKKMYGAFIDQYIPNRFEALATSCGEYVAFPYEYVDKPFDNCGNKQTKQWLNLLQKKHPGVLERWKQQQRDVAKMRDRKEEERKIKEREEAIKALWKEAVDGGASRQLLKGVNVNIVNAQGETPLMIAARNKNYHFIEDLGSADVNVTFKDVNGKTAYDYIPKPSDREEKIFTDRTRGALRMLDAYQRVKGKGKIVESYGSNSGDKITITVIDGVCEDIDLPKYVTCVGSHRLSH